MNSFTFDADSEGERRKNNNIHDMNESKGNKDQSAIILETKHFWLIKIGKHETQWSTPIDWPLIAIVSIFNTEFFILSFL